MPDDFLLQTQASGEKSLIDNEGACADGTSTTLNAKTVLANTIFNSTTLPLSASHNVILIAVFRLSVDATWKLLRDGIQLASASAAAGWNIVKALDIAAPIGNRVYSIQFDQDETGQVALFAVASDLTESDAIAASGTTDSIACSNLGSDSVTLSLTLGSDADVWCLIYCYDRSTGTILLKRDGTTIATFTPGGASIFKYKDGSVAAGSHSYVASCSWFGSYLHHHYALILVSNGG
jgi:hypothetical protein